MSAAMLFSQTVPAAAAPADDELLHLTFDEESAVDVSGSANHGSAHNITYVKGISGKAARIVNANGSSAEQAESYIDLPSTLQLGTSDATFSLWYKADAGTEGGGCVIGNKDYDSGANDGFIIGSFSKNVRANMAFNRTRKDSTFGSRDGNWHHLAVSLDRDGSMRTYEDGVYKGSADISSFAGQSLDINTLRIGADGIGTYGLLDSQVDEVRIFSSVKSDAEIKALYDEVNDTIGSENLDGQTVLQVSFDGNAQDVSGRDNHGDVVGSPEFVEGIHGQALHIVNENGSSSATAEQYVNFGNNTDLKLGTSDFSMSWWAKSDNGVSGGGALISNKDFDSGSNTGINIGNFNNGFRANFRAEGDSRKDLYAIAPIDGNWHYMTLTVDRDGEMTAYRDGEKVNSTDISGSAGKSIDAYNFVVGADGTFCWGVNDAYIDELSLTRSVIDTSADRTIYADGLFGYALNRAAWLIDEAEVYIPEEADLIAAAVSAQEDCLALRDSDDDEARIAAAQALVSALDELEAVLPEHDASLMLHASFDDETAADRSGRGNNGAITGQVTFEDGVTGKGIRIANDNYGTSQTAKSYVDFGDKEDFRFGEEDFTVALWYKENKDNHECSIIGNKDWDSGRNPGWNLGLVGMGLQFNFTAQGQSRKDLKPGQINDGNWHHLAVSVDRAGKAVLYLDGAASVTSDFSSLAGSSIDAYGLVLGADSLYHYGLQDATLDELKVWNRALAASEIEQEAAVGVFESQLKALENSLETADASAARKEQLKNSIASLRSRLAAGEDLDALNVSLNLAKEAFEDPAEDPLISFNVLSDVHVDAEESASQNKNLKDALQDLEYLNPGSAATLFPGDLTNGGAAGQYTAFFDMLDAYSAAWPIAALGNHDVRWLCSSADRNEASLRVPTCVEGTSPFKERYLSRNQKYMGDTPEGQLYYDQWIGGYHFITLNTEKDLKDQAYLSDEQIAWLADILEGSDPEKPIFLQIHQTFQGTADHEELDWIGGESEENLKAVLENYPQAVIFTGHVHNGKNLLDVYNRTYGHVVDVPCFYYQSYGDSQNRIGYQVSVYEDDVVIRLRDFANDTWLDEYTMHVDLDAVDLIDDSQDLDTAGMTISAGSEHTTSGSEGPASNLFDNNTSTIWHTSYSGNGTTMSQRWLEVQLEEDTWIEAIRYLPRQVGSNGTILKANIYVSADHGETWIPAAAASWKGSPSWKSVSFMPVKANAVRIEPTETIGEYASGAELRIAGTKLSGDALLTKVISAAEKVDQSLYTPASLEAFTAALAQAKALAGNAAAAEEARLEAADALQKAMRALEAIHGVTLASYNIAAGKNPNLEAISSQMENYGIEIAGLQEIDVNTGRNSFDMLARLASYGTYPYTSFQKAIDFSGGQYGIGTVSSLPILETSGASYKAAIGENRVWQRSLIEKDGKQIAFYNTHLSYENTEIRKAQMLELIAAVNADEAEYKAITGDFNADQEHSEFFVFLDDFNLTNGHDGTWHDTYNQEDSTMKVFSIDNIITTRNLRLTDMGVVENSLSDHNMIWAEFLFLDEDMPSAQRLTFLLQDAEAIVNDGYSAASWNRLQQAIAAAKDTDGKTQEEIDALEAELKAAMEGLSSTQNKMLLQQAIAYAQAITEEDLKDVNVIVVNHFRQALARAIEVEADPAATQAEIDRAWKDLSGAIQMLNFRSDKTELRALIAQAEGLKEADYTADSWAALQAALDHAKEIEASDTALTDSIEEACDALRQAMNALEGQSFDLSLLLFLIETAEAADLDQFVNEDGTLDAFKAALASARAVAAAPENQEAIDSAVLELNAAWLNLRLQPDESLIALLENFLAETDTLNLMLYSEEEIVQIQACAGKIRTALASGTLSQKTAESLAEEAEALRPLLDRKPEEAKKPVSDPQTEQTAPKTEPGSTSEGTVSSRVEEAGEPVQKSTAQSVKTSAATNAVMAGVTAAAAGSVLALLKRRRNK